jgi:hypothetical protein
MVQSTQQMVANTVLPAVLCLATRTNLEVVSSIPGPWDPWNLEPQTKQNPGGGFRNQLPPFDRRRGLAGEPFAVLTFIAVNFFAGWKAKRLERGRVVC